MSDEEQRNVFTDVRMKIKLAYAKRLILTRNIIFRKGKLKITSDCSLRLSRE
jgi:hypothetical protein